MSFLRNLRLAYKLGGAFFMVVVLTVVVGLVGVTQLRSVDGSTEEILTNWLPSVSRLADLRDVLNDHRLDQARLVLSDSREDIARFEKALDENRLVIQKANEAYEKLISSPEERKLYDAFVKAQQAFLAMEGGLKAQMAQGDAGKAEAAKAFRGETRDAFLAAMTDLDVLVELNQKGASAAGDMAAQTYKQATSVLIGMMLAAVAVASLLATVITRMLTRPVGRAVAAVAAIEGGDLTTALETDGRDEIAQLLQSLDRMQNNLRSIVLGVRQNAESVATASSEIAQGNADLSSRTEQQASSLEETAASMEELSSTVSQNAENAQQADALSKRASEVAAEGGAVVEQVVHTMKGIQESSERIAEIISVIDGIAFQTNILALNAAVEAARAGEQGRGFAVVAGEVRTLAQRSAEAAKEIKQLIGASVERVEQGSALVGQAGTTMNEVVNSVRRVTDLMAEISAASREQSTGVTQVGEAITQMDQVTQQNAALVEESAAAAESLRGQATQLVTAVAVFKLPGQSDVRAATPVRSAVRRSPGPVAPARATGVRKPAAKPALSQPDPAMAGDAEWAAF